MGTLDDRVRDKMAAYAWFKIVNDMIDGKDLDKEFIKWLIEEYGKPEIEILSTTFRYKDVYIPIILNNSDYEYDLDSNLLKALISVFKMKASKYLESDYIPFPPFDLAVYDKPLDYDPSKKYVEVDVSKAYMTTAYLIGLISEKLYKKLLNHPLGKLTFLVALGSTQQDTIRLTIDEKTLRPIISSGPRIGYFYNLIASLFVSRTKRVEGIARWIDAWLVEEDRVESVQEEIKEAGYDSKIKGYLKGVVGFEIEDTDDFGLTTVWFVQKEDDNECKRWFYVHNDASLKDKIKFPVYKVKSFLDIFEIELP